MQQQWLSLIYEEVIKLCRVSGTVVSVCKLLKKYVLANGYSFKETLHVKAVYDLFFELVNEERVKL